MTETTAALARTVKRSLFALRAVVADLDGDQADSALRLAVEEGETLSKGAAALARRAGASGTQKVTPPPTGDVPGFDIFDVTALLDLAAAAIEHGTCDRCGGVLFNPPDSVDGAPQPPQDAPSPRRCSRRLKVPMVPAGPPAEAQNPTHSVNANQK